MIQKTRPSANPGGQWGTALPRKTLIGFVVALIAVLSMTAVSYRALQSRSTSAQQVVQSHEIMRKVESILSTVKDAETGQRGFLLTGADRFIEPYTTAINTLPRELAEVRRLAGGSLVELQRLDSVDSLIAKKLAELKETITLQRAGKSAAALELVRAGQGQEHMDRLRAVVEEMLIDARAAADALTQEWERAVGYSIFVLVAGAAVLLFLITAAAIVSSQDMRLMQVQAWLRNGQNELGDLLQGEHDIDTLGGKIIDFVARYLNAQVGAVYFSETGRPLRLIGGYALPVATSNGADRVRPVGGLTQRVLQDRSVLLVSDVPPDYFPVSSGLGRGQARHLVLSPVSADGLATAVMELGFFHTVSAHELEWLRMIAEPIGMALRTAQLRKTLARALEESQLQGEVLQSQQEELRASNEELEAQSRALQESAVRQEEQQAELEETNTQLETQSEELQAQKDGLERAQRELTVHSDELSRANRVKSEFLANMSHELRTPLNSALILSKLLADNAGANLTEEQVQFSQTIHSANTDLLTLINDILDLSKIEAGQVDVHLETLSLRAMVEQMRRTFDPLAAQKGVRLETSIKDPNDSIVSDGQRLQQVLKNLVFNAVKFTEHGTVQLTVDALTSADGVALVRFCVIDTGVGIASEHQGLIFEAFRQADGSTHRKYGGTGLGLSISRELSRLLGGDVTLHSAPGVGSTFTLTVPRWLGTPGTTATHGPAAPPMAALAAIVSAPMRAIVAPIPVEKIVDDDRDTITPMDRVILVVEDDAVFARILVELGRERGFKVVVAPSAEDGIAAVHTYHPVGVLLDVRLPDHSGLTVLDRLKHNSAMRHIPVHMISAEDHVQQALELGALGYTLKPVKREELLHAIQRMEQKLVQTMGRVLVVEDSAHQRQAIEALLGQGGVSVTSVATASDALAALHAATFDCMVVDLTLPDFSGYQLLERMAADERYSHPPVIVHTGSSLSRDEEQRLNQYSHSIIIKGARSPERLLDEVMLFLHQVEARLPLDRQRMLREARNRDATFEGRRILLAEDDVRNVFALTSVLEPLGATMVIARNGREALATLEKLGTAVHQSGGIDIVLMDIMMPEMDGFAAMRAIRERPQWHMLPIIALTAKAMKDDQQQCIAAGASDYMAKPIEVEKLLSLLRVWMRKR
jgi:CheY-like chemotaxis protein/CHASE3 domain sensor protein